MLFERFLTTATIRRREEGGGGEEGLAFVADVIKILGSPPSLSSLIASDNLVNQSGLLINARILVI